MCRVVQCKKCHKPGWAGCGAHVEQVLGHVPQAERCACRERAPAAGSGDGKLGGALRKLFGR